MSKGVKDKSLELDKNQSLLIASKKGYTEIVKLLLDNCAYIDKEAAFRAAKTNNFVQIIKLLEN